MNALYSPRSGYALKDAVFTGTTPMVGYSVERFAAVRPDWKVKYDVATVTVTATAPTPRKGEVFALPMHNVTAESATILHVTNDEGVDVAVPIPALPSDDLPLTPVIDLRLYVDDADLTADVWSAVITSNGTNVTLGAAMWVGTLIEFERDFVLGAKDGEKRFNSNTENAAGTVNRMRWRTRQRWRDVSVPASSAQEAQLRDWMRAGEGSGLASLFWPEPAVNDALLGTWSDDYASTKEEAMKSVSFRFTELSKGVPPL